MTTNHAIDRDLQRHWDQDRDWHGKYAEKKDPDQMGIAGTGQFQQALKKNRAVGMRPIGQCR